MSNDNTMDMDMDHQHVLLQHHHDDDYGQSNSSSGLPRSVSTGSIYHEDQKVISDFLRKHTCYDLLPISAKVVIFDITLEVRYAFYAMVQNEIRAAPLWDSDARKIVGMLTVTDFISILRHYYKNNWKSAVPLEEHQIQSWRQIALNGHEQPLHYANPMESLYSTALKLVTNRIHRVPLIDYSNGDPCCLSVITQLKILRFIACNLKDKLDILNATVSDLHLGTYENIATCTMQTPLIDVLNIFEERKISALPIIDDDGTVLDVYEKFDVTYLAHDKAYENLNMTVREAIEHRQEGTFEGVHTCTTNDTLHSILDAIRENVVHRFIIVDSETKLKGVISVSDILLIMFDTTQ